MTRRVIGALWAVAVAPALFGAVEWRPVEPAILALKAPRVDPNADAEAVFWEVRLRDQVSGAIESVLDHYIRIKVFTERGLDKHGKVEIPYINYTSIRDIGGRTVKADGRVVTLGRDAVFDREALKRGGLRIKVKSFSMPSVDPGDVIEYQWTEVRGYQTANYLRLYFQRELPIWSVKYFIKPLPLPGTGMRSIRFQCKNTPFEKQRDGYYMTSMSDVPAFVEEDRMPPEDQVRSWMLLYYSRDEGTPEEYWRNTGKALFARDRNLIRADGFVRKTAETVTAGAATPFERLERIAEYCRRNIHNLTLAGADASRQEVERARQPTFTPADAIRQRSAFDDDINRVFVALAQAVGFDARLARLPDRGDIFFNPAFPETYFLRDSAAAVFADGQWKFYDVSRPYLPTGMLHWRQEGTVALVPDEREPTWIKVAMSGPELSVVRKLGRVRLDTNGSVSGEVRFEFIGHPAIEERRRWRAVAEAERPQRLLDYMKSRLRGAEVTDARIENLEDLGKPITLSCRSTMRGWAQRTGRRLFLRPEIFQGGWKADLEEQERRHSLYFDYPKTEDNHIEIELPEGYQLDNADQPASSKLGEVGLYQIALSVNADGTKLTCRRRFTWGIGGAILFPASAYAQVKAAFDFVHKSDNHAVALRMAQ